MTTWNRQPPPPAPPAAGWRAGASAAPPSPSRAWLYRAAAALVGAAAVGAAAVWVVLWLAPPGPAVIVGAAASYESNLNIAANPQGRETARRLLALAAGSSPLSVVFGNSGKLRAAGPLAEVRRGTDWARGLDDAPERTAIAYLGLHGGADAEGAFLFPNDSDGEERIRLESVIDRLDRLPASRHKLLLLDATGNPSDLASGQLTNGFARALDTLDARIAAVPNLVVISASGPDERSWPSATMRTSLFGKHLVDALAAGGPLDAARLFDLLGQRISTDAHRLYGARQRPVLLPRTDGSARARRISLAFKVPAPETDEVAEVLPAIQAAWRDYHAFGSRMRAAEAACPRALSLWRAWLLRHEQLLLAGAPAGQAMVRAREAADLVKAATAVPLASAADSLAGPALAGETELETPAPFPALEELWSARPPERGATWERLRPIVSRRLLQQGLIERAAANPARNLAHAAELMRLIDDPVRAIRPIEAHVLVLMARDLPPGSLEGDHAALVQQALRLRLDADRIAFAVHSGGYAHAESVWPWVAPTIEDADAAREQGQDLLFSSDASRAAGLFAQAEEAHRRARADGAAVRSALSATARAWSEMASHLPWLAASDDDSEKVALAVFADAHRVEQLLASPPRPRDPEKLEEMRTRAASLEAGLATLRDRLDMYARNRDAEVPRASADVWRALASPNLAPATRWRLVQRLERLPKRERSTVEAGPVPTPDDLAASDKTRAARLGRFALAELGPVAFTSRGESFDRVRHRLENFAVEERWWLSLWSAGERIGEGFRGLPPRMKTQPRLALRLDPGQWQQRDADPMDAARRAGLARLLVWQASRTWKSHWHGEDNAGPPYYRVAGLDCLADATGLDRTAVTPQIEALFRRASGVRIDGGPARHLLAGERLALSARIDADDGLGGFPVLWAEPGSGLSLPREADVRRSTVPLTVTVASPDLEKDEQTPPVMATPRSSRLTWRGYFRGHRPETPTPVSLHPVAESTRTDHARPPRAAVAVRAAPGLLAKHGVVKGALALVLDCSGSTGPPPGKEMTESTRYRQLVRALRGVLAEVPRGTAVSVWVFGQSGPAKTPEETIERVQEPTAWDGTREQLDAVMAKVDGLVPWNESPIVRTILRAKEDLVRAEGARSLVVLTDGVDNRIARDATFNPDKKAAGELLAEKFKGSNVALHIVGFQVADREEEDARKQFEGVTKFTPPGTYTTVGDVDALLRSLRRAMRPELKYRLVGDGMRTEEVGVAAEGESDRWLAVRPEGERAAYGVEVTTGWPMKQRLSLAGGDALLMEITAGGASPGCRRVAFSRQDEHRLKPARETRGWRASVLQNQLVPVRAVQMLASLEERSGDEGTVTQAEPKAIWLELVPSAAGSPAVRWGRLFGHPAPCWGIDAPGWPAGAKPRLGLWWSPDVEPSSRLLRQGIEFRTLDELPRRVRVSADVVTVDSASIERRWVWATPSTREQRWCLVVRCSHTAGEPLMALPEGLPPAGQEHRHHTSAGRYAGLFWFDGADSAERLDALLGRRLTGVRLYSLGMLKREAEDRRYRAAFELDAPTPEPGRPRPVFDPR